MKKYTRRLLMLAAFTVGLVIAGVGHADPAAMQTTVSGTSSTFLSTSVLSTAPGWVWVSCTNYTHFAQVASATGTATLTNTIIFPSISTPIYVQAATPYLAFITDRGTTTCNIHSYKEDSTYVAAVDAGVVSSPLYKVTNASGAGVLPTTDLGPDIGSTSARFSNIYVNKLGIGTVPRFTSNGGTGSNDIVGGATSGSSAVGNKLGNANTLSSAGDLIAGFYSDNVTTLKMSVDKDGLIAGTSTKMRGTITLSTGSGTATVNASAFCVCTDTTANASVKCAVSSTTLTATGTGSDVIAYICIY